MSRFKPGDQVVCTSKNWWRASDGQKSNGPAYNSIVTVGPYYTQGSAFDREAFFIADYAKWYHEANFEPIITDSQLEEELNQIEHHERSKA
jgi:hypothetical protein